jgi:secondary thiamine-phosphate synthase enzyme
MTGNRETLSIETHSRDCLVDLTARIGEAVARSGIRDGLCHVFCPHTTAGLTINEHADPDVAADLLVILDRLVPLRGGYRHAEGNSAAHAKALLCGQALQVVIENGRLQLGTWQGIFFCEFDGPQSRSVRLSFWPGTP